MALATATNNVLKNVKLIGLESKNGRIYPPSVLKNAVHLYEGAKVNIDHPERGPAQERKIGDRIGLVRNARFVEGRGIFADFVFNPHHPVADRLAWDAEHNPEAFGFSHNATLRLGRPDRNGNEVVESIVAIRSIDLVADPATTSSLFESVEHRRESASQLETDRQYINLLASKLRQPRETLSELRTKAELLQRTLDILERPARQMIGRWETGREAKSAREAELRRLASRLKR